MFKLTNSTNSIFFLRCILYRLFIYVNSEVKYMEIKYKVDLSSFFIWIIVIINPFVAQSQSTVEQSYKTKITPPSPNAAALGKYGDIPVSYYTGIPSIEIPIANAKSGEILVPITLSYHAGGVKLNEEAGWTGLGWTLNAGGAVSRMINDKDDLTGTYFTTLIPEMTQRTTTSTATMNETYDPEFNQYVIQGGGVYDWTNGLSNFGGFDLETDIFNYNFNGRGGKFSFTRSQQIIQERKSDLLLERIGSGFKITDENGIQYLFTIAEMTDNGAQVLPTSWYLSKIYSPKGDSVSFNYITGPNTAFLPRVSEIYRKGCDVSQYDITSAATSHQIKYLTSITHKNGRVDFEYTDGREDLSVPASGKKLTSIKLYAGTDNVPYKRFEFTYSYFNNALSYVFKRLRLDKVTEFGSDGHSLPPHQFTYEEAPAPVLDLTGKNSFSVDHWGYFNGAPNTSYVPGYTGYATWGSAGTSQLNTTFEDIPGANRETNPLYSKIFSLKEIKYPTGGKSVFEFESNTYDHLESTQGQPFDIQQMQLVDKQQQFTISAAGTTNGSIDFSNKYGNVEMTITFRCSVNDGCNTVRSAFPYGTIYFQSLGYLRDLMGGEVTCNPAGPICTTTLTNLDVPNQIHAWTAYIAPAIVGLEDIVVIFRWKESVTVQPSYLNQDRFLYCGGIRVKKITNYSSTSKVASIKNYSYHISEDRDSNGSVETYSFGKRMSPPSYYRNEILTSVLNGGTHIVRCPSFTRYSNSVSELSTSAQGNIVGYDRVVEFNTDSTGNTIGKTVMDFINEVDSLVSYRYPAVGAIHGSGFLDNLPIRKPGIRNLKNNFNGNLISKTTFKSLGGIFQKVREELSYYSYKNRLTLYNLTFETVSGNSSDVQLTSVFPAFRAETIQLDSIITNDFSMYESQFVSTKTKYYYENSYHVQPTRVLNYASDGNPVEQRNRNPLDNITGLSTEASTAKAELVARHIIAPVLESENTENLQSKVVRTNYKIFGNGFPLPANVETKIGSGSLEKRVEFLAYDDDGNLTAQAGVSDVVSSYIWGYNNSLLIAEATNANPNEIFFTSFEESEATSTSGDAHNGVWSRGSGYIKLLTGLTTNKTYLLTYWQKQGTVWELQSQEVTLSAPQVTFEINLDGQVDDVRFHPKAAQMTTYTHDLAKGITSVMNPGNSTQYFNYDEFGRLIAIRDHDKNLLKTYKYHYKGQ